MAKPEKRVNVVMLRPVQGEDLEHWAPDDPQDGLHECGEKFARWLVYKGKARFATEADASAAEVTGPIDTDSVTTVSNGKGNGKNKGK